MTASRPPLPLTRRQALAFAAAATAGVPLAASAAPVAGGKPVRLIVSYAAGGGADLMARLVAPGLAETLGQPVEVENRPGKSGQIAALEVAKAAPDGSTLLFDASSFAANPALFPQLPYDSDAAFSTLGVLALFPNVLLCHPAFGADSVKALLAQAKAQPGSIAYASSGNGSAQHLAGALFEYTTGVELKHVPYNGGGPAMADVIAGKVPLFFGNVASTLDHVRAGRLRPMAVTTRRRTRALPAVPSMAEAGVHGYEMLEWNPVLAPAGIAPDTRATLVAALRRTMARPEVAARVHTLSGEVFPDGPDGMAAGFIKAAQVQWTRVIKARGIKPA